MNWIIIGSILIVVLFVVSTVWIVFIWGNPLDLKDKISNTTLLVTCFIAMITFIAIAIQAHYLKCSYDKSLQPALLVQVRSEITGDGKPTGRIIISYKNVSNNPFNDLIIYCKVQCGETTVDLSKVFTPNMYMGPYDSRDRRISLPHEFEVRGHNFDGMINANKETILSLSFSYKFLNKLHSEELQKYKFNNENKMWEII